jgi:hypothetical protein
MTIIRAGLLNQSFGRGSGACDGASAPGSLTFSGGGFQLGEHMKAATKKLAGDGHGGDVGAAASGGLGIEASKWRTGLGSLGGLLEHEADPRRAILVMWPWRRVRSEVRTAGVSPAQAHSLRAVGKRVMSPISAAKVRAVIGPIPGRPAAPGPVDRAWSGRPAG